MAKKPQRPKHPNYLRKLLALQRWGALHPGTASHVDVLHDDWCGVFTGTRCHCDPEIRLRLSDDTARRTN